MTIKKRKESWLKVKNRKKKKAELESTFDQTIINSCKHSFDLWIYKNKLNINNDNLG